MRSILFLALAGFSAAALAIEPGDMVVVKQDADLKVSGKVVGKVKAGEALTVHAVRGAWVQVGSSTKGWIRTDNVAAQGGSIDEITNQLAEKPGDIELLLSRARMHLTGRGRERRQRVDLAEQDLREVLQHEPTQAEARYFLAEIELRRENRVAAREQLDQAIELKDDDARFFVLRGHMLQQDGDISAAAKDFEKAAELGTTDALRLNNLAWWMATSSDVSLRNGKKAVKYATRACELTNYKNYTYVDTLAAAYAEVNDFPSAIRWQDEAVRLCDDSTQKVQCQERLKLYQANQPYRETSR